MQLKTDFVGCYIYIYVLRECIIDPTAHIMRNGREAGGAEHVPQMRGEI